MFGGREYKALNKMLDQAIEGEFVEEHFDERELSKFQSKFKRYLVSSSMSEKRIREEKDRIKELITDISHQTKTPLTNIMMYSELLAEIASDDRVRDYADEICVHSRKLEDLIQALVKMSRLETGILQLRKEPVSVNRIVDRVMDQGNPKAGGKGIRLVFDRGQDLEIQADERWIMEAVYNILDNGIKYSGQGSVIRMETFCYEIFCGIRIRDQGPGISEEEIPRIFTRFYRGANTGNEEGIGVGLYLARNIVEEHGGYIKVKSQEGGGTTFDICFPNMTTMKD